MKYTKTRTHRFNMGAYEHLEISATVEADSQELDPEFDTFMQIDVILDDMLDKDIARANETSRAPEEDTYLHAWYDVLTGKDSL